MTDAPRPDYARIAALERELLGIEPDTAEQDARAVELRAEGWSYRRIAAELDVTEWSAREMVRRALHALAREPTEVRPLTPPASRLQANVDNHSGTL